AKYPTIQEAPDGGKYHTVVSQDFPEYQEFRQSLAARAMAVKARSGPPMKGEDIVLSVVNDARIASIDLSLVAAGGGSQFQAWRMAGYAGNPQDKLHNAANKIYEKWVATSREKLDPEWLAAGGAGPEFKGLTQIVFAEIGVWSKNKANAMAKVKELLIAKGIPADEIADVNERTDHLAGDRENAGKLELYDQVISGEVRILMGSMKKLGTGVNVQKWLVAGHWLDPPWTPHLLAQSEGRLFRPGNENPKVEFYQYVQIGGQDESMYSLVFQKYQSFQAVLSGQMNAEDYDDLDANAIAFQHAQGKASLNPMVLEWTKVRGKLQKLQTAKKIHIDSQLGARRRQAELEQELRYAQTHQPIIKKQAERAASAKRELVTVDGRTLTVPNEIGAELVARVMDVGSTKAGFNISAEGITIGTVPQTAGDGFPVSLRAIARQGTDAAGVITAHIEVLGRMKSLFMSYDMDKKQLGALAQRVMDTLGSHAGEVQRIDATIVRTQQDLESIIDQVDKPFGGDTELEHMVIEEGRLKLKVQISTEEPVRMGAGVDIHGKGYNYRGIRDGLAVLEPQPDASGKKKGDELTMTPEELERIVNRPVDVVPFGADKKPVDKPGQKWDEFSKEGYKDSQFLIGVPADMRVDVLKWIRTHGSDRPVFGMGAAFAVPDPRGW
ncbi:MAG: hypothetical protein V3S47_00470, partial [Acidobacteriota bacterium]